VGDRAKEKGLSSPGHTRSLYSAIETVKKTNDAGFRAANGSDRVLTVVYERLVGDPKRETTRVCDFLRLPWSEEMIRPGEKRHDGEKTLDGVWYTDNMFYSNPGSWSRAQMEGTVNRGAARRGCDVVRGRREPQSSRLRALRGVFAGNAPSRFQSEIQSLYRFKRRVFAARLLFDAEPPLEATREEAELASQSGATPTLLSGSVIYFSGDRS